MTLAGLADGPYPASGRPHVDRSAALRSGAIPIDSAVMGGRRTRAGAYAAAG
ncbi:hypothetical protein EDC02_0751 [Micromonospora sp. Llam0]|uniref:hypothetical protein n=1 Tax=Micromonospora sp. Llam0 TaxID=2485143 RepID=UPI000FB67144|nr:hypothetical protein [Micromonospora sp. Llam0]ROO58977.1 hypothetical protein EDC02_0751 [Micromonospora sp. Llam0]